MEWIAIAIVAVVAFLFGFGVGKSRNVGSNDTFPLNGARRVGTPIAPGAPATTAAAANVAPAVTPGELPEDVMKTVQAMLLKGRQIEAIKVYRTQTGAGLKESKDAVEAIQRAMKRPPGSA